MNIRIAKKLHRAGLSIDEIAEVLKLPPKSVANLLTAEIYDEIKCNSDDEGGIVVNEPNKTFARERGTSSHIVVSRENGDGDTHTSAKDDDASQRNTRGLREDYESLYEGVGGTLAESEDLDDEDAGLSGISDNNLDRLGLFALADAVRGLASAIRSATGVTVIPKGDDR